MNRKDDKRNLETKYNLINSFKKMAKDKPLDKITINDITKVANVNRNTFYYHFEDIYNLIDFIFKTELNKIIEQYDKKSPREFLNIVFDYLEENKNLTNSIYSSIGREKSKEVLHPYFHKIMDNIISKQMKENNLKFNEKFKNFIIDFYSEGIASSLINYFKGTQTLSKEEMIEYFLYLNEKIPKLMPYQDN